MRVFPFLGANKPSLKEKISQYNSVNLVDTLISHTLHTIHSHGLVDGREKANYRYLVASYLRFILFYNYRERERERDKRAEFSMTGREGF